MIDDYVNKLIENLPEETKTLQHIDLVLDGGMFNGSYLVGSLYFLKEMERRNYIKIERISGCSIGSIVAFLYYMNALDLMPSLYDIVNKEFKKTHTLSTLKSLKTYLKDRIPNDICSKINNKLFICYHDIKKRKKVVKSNYKNVDDVIHTIVKSCYVPFLIDNNMLYKKKYIDGINAYIFNKQNNRKILHMELFGYDKIIYALNIKNEKNNFHRILSGLLDIHSFFIKKSNTPMCSYVNDWSLLNKFNYNFKLLIEYLLVNICYITLFMKKYIPDDVKDNLILKILSTLIFHIFSAILETYCF
jgi:ssDNA-binding Zn-finger/Zn-ribbon topoisomerase 1